jgi:regulator of ribonuclease activity A
MALSVPDICDDHIDRLQVLDPVFRDLGGREKFCGEVVTVRCFEDNSVVKTTLSGDGSGKVLVVDGSGSMRCALLGDMLAAMARDNGWQGVVVNGCVRDVEILSTIDLGVRALNAHPVRSKKRGEGELNLPVRFAGVSFRPGQYLYADANGIVIAEKDLGVSFT